MSNSSDDGVKPDSSADVPADISDREKKAEGAERNPAGRAR